MRKERGTWPLGCFLVDILISSSINFSNKNNKSVFFFFLFDIVWCTFKNLKYLQEYYIEKLSRIQCLMLMAIGVSAIVGVMAKTEVSNAHFPSGFAARIVYVLWLYFKLSH